MAQLGGSNLHLVKALVKRDLELRFTGSALGFLWAILQPLLLVFCYWFVFTIMIPRAPDQAGEPEYVFFLISGLVPWLGFADAMTRSTTALVENAPMIRRLTFRSEVLITVPSLTAIIFQFVGLAFFIVYLLFRGQSLSALWLLAPVTAIQFLLQTGLGWILAVLNVFFRDVIQVLTFLLSIGLFLSPVFYSVDGRFETIFRWNPMTPLLGLFRSALLGTELPEWSSVVYLLMVAAGVFALGLRFFRRAQPTLADLL